MRGKWAARIAFAAVIPVFAAVALFALLALRHVRSVTQAGLEADLRRQVQLLAAGFEGRIAGPELGKRVADLAARVGCRITIIAEDGRVLAESARDPGDMENHAERPEVVAARKGAVGLAQRHSHTLDRDLLYGAVQLKGSRAVVRIARDMTDVNRDLERPTRAIFWIGLGVLLFAALLATGFALRIARPVEELTDAAERVARGERGVRVRPRGEGEMARMGGAFNRMAEQLEQSLHRARSEAQRLGALLHGMWEGVVAVDAEERISFMNGAARKMLGIDRETPVEKRRILELVRDPRLLELAAEAAKADAIVEAELVREGPPRITIQVHAAQVATAPPGVVLVLRDQSRLRRLERMRSDFVSNVSHELRTPLAAILAAAETLADTQARLDPREGPRFVEAVLRNARRLEALVGDILALSQLESRPETLAREQIDFGALVRTACSELAGRAKDRGVRLAVDAAEEAPVRGDARMLQRIADNLVANAIDYTPQGGRVQVALKTERGRAVLEVADTGIGIPRRSLDRIFERFYRVDPARSRSAGGTGLGLAIVKHAAGLHGGVVEVESRVGEGSTFRVSIPLRPVQEGGSEDDEALPA